MITVKIGNKDYVIEFGLRAAYLIEDETKLTTTQIFEKFSENELNLRLFGTLFYAGLKSRDRGVTIDRALNIIDQIGDDFAEIYSAVVKEYIESFTAKVKPPVADEDNAKNTQATV